MSISPPKKPPSAFPLLEKKTHAATGGEERVLLTISLQTITPIYGGSTKPRYVDSHDPIRISSIRGCLLFWWRALYAHTYKTSEELYAAQNDLWGGVFGDKQQRSKIEITVKVTKKTEIDRGDVSLSAPDAYALFPAKSMSGGTTPPAERWKKGLDFQLRVWVPKGKEEVIKKTLRAWIVFGGYGGRTRRGLGSLTVTADQKEWLPEELTKAELQRLFGTESFQDSPPRPPTQTPSLLGARLCKAKQPGGESEKAWHGAIKWLRDFRQDRGTNDWKAREQGDGGRPGRSRWPEADKVRQISGRGPWAHPPRHNATPVWPRASFGLPIIAQFQRNAANRQRYPNPEPRDFAITWYEGNKKKNRLASALIVKPVALAGGKFVAVALWMYRAFPEGEVGLEDPQRERNSRANFDVLVARGDTALFSPLVVANPPKHFAMREAFFGWLVARAGGERIV